MLTSYLVVLLLSSCIHAAEVSLLVAMEGKQQPNVMSLQVLIFFLLFILV